MTLNYFRFGRANVGLISFSDDAVLNFNMGTYRSTREVLAGLQFGKYGGKTNTQAALRLLLDEMYTRDGGDRNGVDNKVILITDGRSNIQERRTISTAEDVKDADIDLYVLAIGDNPDMNEVNGISSDPDNEYVFPIRSPLDIQDAVEDLLDNMCDS